MQKQKKQEEDKKEEEIWNFKHNTALLKSNQD